MNFAANKSSYYALTGGLDLVSPAIAFPPGRTFDSLNYEPELTGGYKRVAGYERFDGRASPTDTASYIVVPVTLTGNAVIDREVVGVNSGKRGKLVGKVAQPNGETLLVLSQPTLSPDAFFAGEQFTIDGVLAGVTTGISTIAVTAEQDADFQLLATNDIRRTIGAVPGSGPVRGIAVLNDVVYAFRDSVSGQTGEIYRASPVGWQKVDMVKELQFRQGAVAIKVGDTISNGLSGAFAATGFVVGVAVRSGVWHASTNQAVGTLYIVNTTGAWTTGQSIQVATVTRAVADSTASTIQRQPGGTLEVVRHNFSGLGGKECLYGVDGKNRAFQFDGFYYLPIRTGTTPDAPTHLAVHLNRLFLSFGPNIVMSSPGAPLTYDGTFGAAELATGEPITGLLSMVGNSQGAAMAVFTKNTVHMFYGNTSSNFQLQPAVTDIGYAAGSIQPVSGSGMGLTARGLQLLSATQAYGDFAFAAISLLIQPLLKKLRGKEVASTILRSRDQYRLYFNDGTILAVGLSSQSVSGIMPLRYKHPVRCVVTHTFTDGRERTFFGSDDGFVYETDKGTSFDGQAVEFWIRLGFSHEKSPRMRKRWRRAVFEAKCEGFARLQFSHDLGYGNPDITPPPLMLDAAIAGGQGSYWDQLTWEDFRWDAEYISSPSITLEGTEKNISLIVYGERAQDAPHSLQGVSLIFSERRTER